MGSDEKMVFPAGRRKFCCPQCAKCFTSNSGLKQHMNIHASYKPFTCQVCSLFPVSSFEDNYVKKAHWVIYVTCHETVIFPLFSRITCWSERRTMDVTTDVNLCVHPLLLGNSVAAWHTLRMLLKNFFWIPYFPITLRLWNTRAIGPRWITGHRFREKLSVGKLEMGKAQF